MRDAEELATRSPAMLICGDKEPLADVEAGRNATLVAIIGRTATDERRVAERKEVALRDGLV